MSRLDLLSDLRVLDLAGESGVFAGRLLADLGADVVRIEPPGGDAVRRRAPFLQDKDGLERSLHHLHYNRNKRSVVLDLEAASGREAFMDLARSADVVLETAPPGWMDGLGIGYEALRSANSGLVYATVTPFGQEGPFRHYKGSDITGAAASGFMYLNGSPDGPPNVAGGEQAYKMASLVAAASVLMAIAGRKLDQAGRGRRVDVSVQEAASMVTVQTANANIYHWHRRIPKRMGNTSGLQRCKDGKWISFVLRTGIQANWGDFAQWLRDEEIDSPVLGDEWQDEAYRIGQRAVVAEAIARLCAKHDRDYLFHEGQKRKQLVLPVSTVADLLEDEQLRARSFFAQVQHPELGVTLTDTGLPYRFSEAASSPSRRAPLLGEHTEEALAEAKTRPAPARPSSPPGEDYDPTKPLRGIRVADFTWLIAGPSGSRILADYGAEVIKIESEYRVDNIRVVGVQPPGKNSLDTNGVFNDCNTNKVSVRLNINHPKGLELAKEIVARSDIVLNNYTAERMPRWGLGYEDLKKIKPDIIMLSMPVMGSTGPFRNYGAYGNGVVAYSGVNMITGFADKPPTGVGPLYSDFSAPFFMATAVMAALHYRQRTGKGQFIDMSQAETTISLLGPAFLEYSGNGRLPERRGNRAPDRSPHGAFRCAGDDRWCAISVADDAEWVALCQAMGRPDLAADARLATLQGRKQHEDEVEQAITTWTCGLDAWQVMHILQSRGVTAAVVEDLEDMCVRDPWLSKQHLTSLPFPEEGIDFLTHNQPGRMDGRTPSLVRSPRFGEHSEQVIQGLLGRSAEEYESLLIEGVVF